MKLTVRAKFIPSTRWTYIADYALNQTHFSGYVDGFEWKVDVRDLRAAIESDIRKQYTKRITEAKPYTFEIEVP